MNRPVRIIRTVPGVMLALSLATLFTFFRLSSSIVNNRIHSPHNFRTLPVERLRDILGRVESWSLSGLLLNSLLRVNRPFAAVLGLDSPVSKYSAYDITFRARSNSNVAPATTALERSAATSGNRRRVLLLHDLLNSRSSECVHELCNHVM